MKKLKTFVAFALLLTLSLVSSAQFTDGYGQSYGGGTDPGNIVGGQYANTVAYFDSNGVLRGGTGATCSKCAGIAVPLTRTVNVNSTQISNLYTTPDTLLPAPGTGYSYNIISAYATITYNSTTFTGDSVLILKINTSASPAMGVRDIVNATSNQTGAFNTAVIGNYQFYPTNEPLLLTTLHQNVSGGNSTLRVTFYYTLLYTGLSSN